MVTNWKRACQSRADLPRNSPDRLLAWHRTPLPAGMAATNAKKEFLLTDKDLRGVERVDKSR